MKTFNHRASSLSKHNLAYLAYCSNLVYENKSKIAKELEKLGFDLSHNNYFFSDKKTGTQAFVVGDSNKIIVCFRGSQLKTKDWATNI